MTLDEYKKFKNATIESSAIEDYRKYKASVLSNTNKQEQSSTLATPQTVIKPMQTSSNSSNKIGNAIGSFWNSGVGKAINTVPAALAQLGVGAAQGVEGTIDFVTSIGANGRQVETNIWQKAIDKTKADIAEEEKRNPNTDLSRQKNILDMIQKYVDTKNENTDKMTEFVGKQWVQDSVGQSVDEFTDKYSYLPVTAGQVVKSVGNMLPAIAGGGAVASKLPQAATTLGKVGTKAATMLPFMAQAAGSSTEQALNEGANLADATKYGLASGAIEGAIESISGGIGGSIGGKLVSSKLGKEAIERITKNALGKFALRLADAGIDVAGEGFEEVLSTAINPLIQRMTYDEKAKLATSEEMMQSFIDGALASMLVKGGQAGLSRVTTQNNANVQENEAQNQAQNPNIEQSNVTLPIQTEMPQNANMEQITQVPNLPTQKAQETLQSAKIAGMTDMDIQKAKELNDMLRSGTRLNFYDEKTIPQNVQADKAKIANGFYKDGTLWINKNSKNKVEQILGHELTHHLETTDSYTDLSNTILDSEVFYDFIAEKGYANVAEYKTKLKEMGYNDAQLDNELVARFVEEKMFTDQKSIDRLARQNAKLVEKIKNWISDLVVSFKGTAQEKELRRIENMYRKALEQARNNSSSNTADIKYYIKKLAEFDETEYNNIQEMQLSPKEYGKLAHIVDTDPSIKPGLNQVETSDATYVIYQKEYNDFKVVDKYEGGVENDATANGNVRGTSETGDGREKLQVAVESIPNQRTAKGNDELLDGNQRARSINVESNNDGINNKKNVAGKEPAFSMPEIKEKQLKIILETNPMNDDYHVGIRNIDDIKTFDEVIDDDESFVWGDFSREDAQEALEKGEIKVYSSKEIKNGNFVSTSYNQARDYAGNGKVYSKIVPLEDVAWISGDEGQYAKVYKKPSKVSFSMPETDNQGRTLSKEQQEFFKDSKVRDENGKLLEVYHGTPSGGFTIFDANKLSRDTKTTQYGKGFYFTDKQNLAKAYSEGENSQLYSVYLDIKKPFTISWLDDKSHNLDRTGLKKILLEGNNNEFYDEWVADSLANIESLGNLTKKEISNMSKEEKAELFLKGEYDRFNDQHVLKELVRVFNTNAELIDSMQRNLGYDGIIVKDKLRGNQYIAFNSNQIKNVDNTNPTENPDIRYSMNPVEVAKNTSNTKALSRYAQTLQSKHQDIPEQINLIQKEVDNGNFTHEVIHDKRSLNYAQKYIEENGFEDAVNHWNELIKRGKPVDKDELALGQTIYNVAVDNKDTKLVMKMASDLVQEYTEIGRNLQSATLLRKMTPDGRLYALERSVQKINQDLMQKFDDFENIQIPEELADELLRSETQKDMDTAVEKIQEYIASKIPATWQEKLNSWRYLAMLGNPRTHIRNIVGNAVFIPAVEMKNVLAQVGELAISKDQRTKAIVTSLSKKDVKLLKYAENDFDNNKETIRGENKYDIKAGVQEKRTIYSWKAVEAARKGNFNLLEAEDTLFLKYRYKKAFAGALKARGITIEQLRENSPETVRKVNEIRTYAINEAQKATYRDASIVASMVSRGKRKLLNAANQSTGASKLGYNLAYLGAEGVMPFAKTPINIVKRGIEYSPAGLLNGVKNAIFDVKSGKVTAAQAIDKIAAGATGTGIAALGLWLASMGLVSGGEEEKEKEQALKQLKGYQDYSLNAFGKSYTIDWTAPSSIPLFIGVELYNSITSEDESAFLNALGNITEPVVEMSMLQGLNDTLTTLGEDSAIGNIVGKTLMNYLGQYNPTVLGQIARSFDPVRRTTYVDKNLPVPAAAQRFIQQQAAKIPGVSRMLPTYKDQFGQEQLTDGVINRIVQNFFSPGYLKDIKEGTVEQGLTELYEKTGETSVIPSYASKSLTHNGEKINLTAKQYDTYAKTRGDLSKKGLEGLFKDNYYKRLSDEQKVKVVEAIYDYAGKIAKTKVIDDYELEFNDKKIQKLQSEGLDFYKYILLKKTADADGNDYTSNDELDKAIKKYGLTRWQKTIKEKNTKTTNKTNTLPTLSQQRAKLPTLKK